MSRSERLAAWRTVVGHMHRRKWLPVAGACMVRMSPRRAYATYHADAPEGASHCRVCGRVVLRGEGRWWE